MRLCMSLWGLSVRAFPPPAFCLRLTCSTGRHARESVIVTMRRKDAFQHPVNLDGKEIKSEKCVCVKCDTQGSLFE